MIDEGAFLNYHHLRYFWTVAREGGLTRASALLGVSKPSICTQIQKLEESLGEELFRPEGRGLALTEFGQQVFGHAEEIFALGSEVLRMAKEGPGVRALRLRVGIVDSFPKQMSHRLLSPVYDHSPPVQLTCQEGKLPDLIPQLGNHRLDVVFSDEPASPGVSGRVFNSLLGTSPVSFCATPGFAKGKGKRFPDWIDGSPALLPTHNCSLRRDLERWFRAAGVQPRVVAEFEDAALAMVAATGGGGFIAVPSVVDREAVERYGFRVIGRTDEVQTRFYAITVERRFVHPAVLAITRDLVQGGIAREGATRK
ncbi:MAG TPA: LysR family transcriptional regulator [Bacteroidia bacterium]|nr:LysR family transcriptional regulator [Bacteroidia bacterium]